MKPEVKVSQVEIVIGEQTIKLSLDEARELLKVLVATIAPEEKEPTKIVERIIERDRYPYVYPYRWTYWSASYSNEPDTIWNGQVQPYGGTFLITAKSNRGE